MSRWIIAALVSLLSASSCDDGQGPGTATFNVAEAGEALESIRETARTSSVVAYLALAPRFVAPSDPAASVRDLESMVSRRIAVLPTAYLGTTFVFDDEQQGYVPSEESGAPADALRFVLYDVDAGGQPLVGSVIGHADLTDDGVELENGFAVGVRAATGGVTFADYTASFVAEQVASGAHARAEVLDHVGLDIAGVLRAVTDEIEVHLVTGTVNDIITTEFELTSGTTTVTGQMSEDVETGSRSLQAELQLSEDNLGVSAGGTANDFVAELTVNGTEWATVDMRQGVVTVSAAGTALGTSEESVALRLAEYFLMIPNLARGMVIGAISQ